MKSKKFDKVFNKVWNGTGEQVYSNDLTYLRKNLTSNNFSYFQKLLKEGDKESFNSPKTQLTRRILSLVPKYFTAGESLEQFKSVLQQEALKPTSAPLSKSIQTMAAQIILSDLISPEEKIFFFFNRGQQSVNTDYISLELVEYGVKYFQQQAINFGQQQSYGIYQIIYQALKRKNFTSINELNLLLVHMVKNHNTLNNRDEFNEDFIKEIKKSPHLKSFSNDLFKEVLSGWQILINTTQIRYDYNNHHQTKKRLERLKAEYFVLREQFREILSTRNDAQSQLDAFLMG